MSSAFSFLVPCGIIAAASAAVFAVHPEYSAARSLIGLIVLVVPLAAALAASFAYARRAGGGAREDG